MHRQVDRPRLSNGWHIERLIFRIDPPRVIGGFAAVIALAAAWFCPTGAIAAPATSPGANAGFETTAIVDRDGETLDVGIWYPTHATGTPRRLGPYSQTVAPNAPVTGASLPLVIMSHGSGGWFGGHADTAVALARAGFIVAAITHKGDSSDDDTQRSAIWKRPPQLKRLTDYMLSTWRDHDRIDPHRIGAFGFSAGGLTVLAAAGGVPRLDRVITYCSSHPGTQTCNVLKASSESIKSAATSLPATAWSRDPRIKAVVVAAPALGFAFGRDGLRDVRLPVQLWRADRDEVLPAPDYADAVRKALPRRPEFHDVANAGHYDFMTPCSPELGRIAPEICVEHPGFDRARFHERFNRAVVAFFRRSM